MAGPWEDYADQAPTTEVGPWSDYADAEAEPATPLQRAKDRRALKGFGKAFRRVDAGVRGAADFLTAGFADEIAATASALPAFVPGGETFKEAYDRNLADERAIDQADREDMPVARGAGQVAGFGLGLGVGAVADLARFAPNALRVGGGVAGNVARSAGLGATYGGIAGFGSAEGNFGERVGEAAMGAALGGGVGVLGVPVAAAISRGANALMTRNAPAIERTANALQSRSDVASIRARANALRDAGADPSFVSATDESGRALVRATASRMTPSREIVQNRARKAAVGLQDRVVAQARRLSQDPRNPREIAADLGKQRRTNAERNFGAVRGDEIAMAPETVSALRTDHGRDAIREAVRRERDPEVRAALNRLANDALDNPSTPISVGMADRISRVLNGRARETRDPDLAATLFGLADDIRAPTASANAGYRAALDEFAAESRIMDAAERGEDFLKRNTDEFIAEAPGPNDPGNELARATARRAIERAAGEGQGRGAYSVADQIAFGREQGMRTRAILPENEARALEQGMEAESRIARDLAYVAPNTGPKTQVAAQDAAALAFDSVSAGVSALGGNSVPLMARIAMRLRTTGLNDADAAAIADIATDPRMLDDLIQRMERIEPGRGRWLREIVNQAGGREAGDMAGRPRAVTVESVGGVPFDEWAANQP